MPMTARNPYRATLPRRRPSIWPALIALVLIGFFMVGRPILVVGIEQQWPVFTWWWAR